MKGLDIITPVKDSIVLSEQTVRAVMASDLPMPFTYTVYDDNSTPENAARLEELARELGFRLIHIAQYVSHPSPNYLWVLQQAQQEALACDRALLVVESDVTVKPETLKTLYEEASARPECGLMAAVTVDEAEQINYPYENARKYAKGMVREKGHLSFCCTLLTPAFLQSFDFHALNPAKNWYDVFLSHRARKNGFVNYLLTDLTVLHRPHSSRPWKLLKYTCPLKYYWRKYTKGLDKI